MIGMGEKRSEPLSFGFCFEYFFLNDNVIVYEPLGYSLSLSLFGPLSRHPPARYEVAFILILGQVLTYWIATWICIYVHLVSRKSHFEKHWPHDSESSS